MSFPESEGCPSATLPPFLSSDAREGDLQSWRRASINNQHQDCCQASKDFARSARAYFSLMPLPLSCPLSLQAIITRNANFAQATSRELLASLDYQCLHAYKTQHTARGNICAAQHCHEKGLLTIPRDCLS